MSDPVMKRAEGDGIQIQLAAWEGEGQPDPLRSRPDG